MVSAAENDRLVWIDCEMTGLSLDADALVEVRGPDTGDDVVLHLDLGNLDDPEDPAERYLDRLAGQRSRCRWGSHGVG